MSSDLRDLLQATEGEGPSPEFRARLRAQIVAETEDTEDGPDIAVVIDLTSRTDEPATSTGRPRLGVILAGLAAAVALIVGLWATLAGDDESGVDVTTETPDEAVIAAEPLTTGNSVFGAGTFRIDTLGTAFTFVVAEETQLVQNDYGVVSLTTPTSAIADDHTIAFRRTSRLPDPTAPTARFDAGDGWPAADLEGWVARLGADVVVVADPVETTLGGFRATYVELSFPCNDGACRPGDLLADPGLPIFTSGSDYRVWVVDQADEDSIVVTVSTAEGADTAWYDIADTILSSLVFESIGRNPVQERPAGSVDIDALGGATLVLPGESTVVEPYDGFARIIPDGLAGDLELLTRPLDFDGEEVTTTDRLLEILRNEAVALTELDPVIIGGQQTRIFGVESGPFPSIVLKPRAEDLARAEFGWESPQFGHLWVVEHPQRGLLVLSTESFGGPDVVNPLFAWASEVLNSLEFRNP